MNAAQTDEFTHQLERARAEVLRLRAEVEQGTQMLGTVLAPVSHRVKGARLVNMSGHALAAAEARVAELVAARKASRAPQAR